MDFAGKGGRKAKLTIALNKSKVKVTLNPKIVNFRGVTMSKKVFFLLSFISIFSSVSCENSTAKTGSVYETTDTEDAEIHESNENTENAKRPVVSWTKQWGTEKNDWEISIATGIDGSVYVAGHIINDTDHDLFLTKFSSDGTKKWTKLWGTESSDFGYAVAAGSNNSIYVAGYSYGSLDGNYNEGGEDVFLTKFSNDGTKKWTKLWGTESSDRGYSMAVSKDGSIYVTGLTGGFFDGFANEGGWDFFLTKIVEE